MSIEMGAGRMTEEHGGREIGMLRGVRSIEPSQLLRFSCVLVVAGVFVVSGASKVMSDGQDLSMVGRYLNSVQSVKALGFAEIGLALWMLSFRMPRMSVGIAAAALVGFTVLIAVELNREKPLPCGCLQASPGVENPHAVRRGLWLSIGRNGVLMALSVVAIALSADPKARLGKS